MRRELELQAADVLLERRVAKVLRAGVILSAFVVACGAALFLLQHGHETPDYRVFRGEPHTLRSAMGIVRDATRPSGRALIGVGLLVLIATPVARVALCALQYLKARDRLYAGITLLVLALLLGSLLGGLDWSVPPH